MNKLGVYLHVPFCKAKCAYCDFYSLTCIRRIGEYESALCRAVRFASEFLRGRELDTLYFGGGTPSLMSSEGLQRVVLALREQIAFSPDAEITVEMNPESVSDVLLQGAREVGVNRLSFGMQSAIDVELSAIGRLHSHGDTVRAVKSARKAGFDNISLDLMYGLPEQTMNSFRESLERCLALSPQHISFYCLTLSESVPLYEKRGCLPGEETVREMYLTAHEILERAGFEHYEISNASLPGFRSRHNQRYWLGLDYLGIGPGAHSLMNGVRFSMPEDLETFLSSSDPFCKAEECEVLTEDDRRTEYVMLSLRRKEGIDMTRLSLLSDGAFCENVKRRMEAWISHGLCRKTSQGYALTPEGFFVSNEMISQLI